MKDSDLYENLLALGKTDNLMSARSKLTALSRQISLIKIYFRDIDPSETGCKRVNRATKLQKSLESIFFSDHVESLNEKFNDLLPIRVARSEITDVIAFLKINLTKS